MESLILPCPMQSSTTPLETEVDRAMFYSAGRTTETKPRPWDLRLSDVRVTPGTVGGYQLQYDMHVTGLGRIKSQVTSGANFIIFVHNVWACKSELLFNEVFSASINSCRCFGFRRWNQQVMNRMRAKGARKLRSREIWTQWRNHPHIFCKVLFCWKF